MDRAAEFLAAVDAVNRNRASRAEAEQVLTMARLSGQEVLEHRARKILRTRRCFGAERRRLAIEEAGL